MKYRVRVGDSYHDVEVTPVGEGRFRVSARGRDYEVTLTRLGEAEDAGYALTLEGETVNFYAQGSPSALELLLGGELLQVEVSRGGGTAAPVPGEQGPLSVRAAMPGLVREVYVQEGDAVERGSRLLVLEAMKMNNEVRSPRSGVVQAVRAAAGQRVDKGEVMVVIGAEPLS